MLRGNESITLHVYLMLRGNGVQPWALRHQQWNHPTLACRPEEWNKKHGTCVDKQISDKAVLRPRSSAFFTLDLGSGIGFPDPGSQTHIFDS